MVLGGRDLAPRRRSHESRGRRGVLAALGVLVLAAAGVGVYLLIRGGPAPVAALPPCPPQRLQAVTSDALPQPREVAVDVLNSTVRAGLARGAATDLGSRGFRVGTVGNAKLPSILHGTAEVHYLPGGRAKAMATVVAEEVPQAKVVADTALSGKAVVVILGDGYARLSTPAEVAEARQRDLQAVTGVSASPTPSLPPCDSSTPSPTASRPASPSVHPSPSRSAGASGASGSAGPRP